MNFLNIAIFGVLLPGLALPLAIHLLNRGLPRVFKFSSIELLKETVARSSRLYRWRHYILMALRFLFLLLLLLAFMLPFLKKFGNNPAEANRREVLILFDHTASMEHTGDGAPSRERGLHEAGQLLDTLGAEDKVNILLLESTPASCFVDFSTDHQAARRYLTRVKPGMTACRINSALAMAATLLGKSAAQSEVYIISDFQRKTWSNANFDILPKAKMFFVDVGPKHTGNRAVLNARVAQGQLLAGDTVPVEVTIGNFSDAEFAGTLSVLVDGKPSQSQETTVPAWSEVKQTVPVAVGGPGVHLMQIKLPSDALAADNAFHLSFQVQEKEPVLIVSDVSEPRASGAEFIKIALNPFEHQAGSLLPQLAGSDQLSPGGLAGTRKLFLTRLKALDEAACKAIAQHLFQGGGVVYFLDGPSDPQNLLKLEEALGSGVMPLRLTRYQSATNVVSGAQQVVRGDFKSPYLRLFEGPARQDLALLDFYDYYQASATAAGGVLLTYADESPAMAVVHHGLGTLLLLNFSPAEMSSNLARQRLFPAWIQELVKSITSNEAAPGVAVIGETLTTEVWRNELRNDEFRSPAGTAVTAKLALQGDRCSVTFKPDQPGFYTLGTPRPLYAFGVNSSPEESDLRPLEKAALPKDFVPNQETHFVSGSEDFSAISKGKPVFHWFVLAGILFLLAETGFQFLLRKGAL